MRTIVQRKFRKRGENGLFFCFNRFFIKKIYRAKEIKCNNAEHPDKYGNFREAIFTQTKHHWWWKANTIFDQLELTKDFTGQ